MNSDYDLFSKLGIELDRASINVGQRSGWKPKESYVTFCDAIGYNPEDQYTAYEEWGIERRLGSKGQGRLLRQFYFTKHPWQNFQEIEEVMEAELPDLDEPGRFDKAKTTIQEFGNERLILGDLGHCQWTKGWELRGMIPFMKDIHTNKKMAEAILDRLNDYYVDLADRLLDLGAEGLRFSEDWGNNKSMFIDPESWRRFFKPRYKKLFDRATRKGGWILFHSDGNITPIVGDLVEIGVDILNPVQPECMDQRKIKEEFGDRITIDTGISVQRTLPLGSVDDVEHEAKEALKDLAPGGGFVYGTSHYALYDVPVENVVALYDTCKKHGRYPISL